MRWDTRCGGWASVRVTVSRSLSADCIEVAETFGACIKIGAIRVGLNPRLAAPEIAALIADCSPSVLFVHTDCTPLLAGMHAGHPCDPIRSAWQRV